MGKAEIKWWLGGLVAIFLCMILMGVFRQEGGFAYYYYSLDWVEVLGTLLVAAISTLLIVWHASVFFGVLFVLGLVLVLARSGRLRGHIPTIGLFALFIALPCVLLWKITGRHLSTASGILLSVFWLAAPVAIYLCVRHVILRRNEMWTGRDRRVAYMGASFALLMGCLSMGTLKSDGEVQRSLERGREVVYAIKHYQQNNQKLPETLQDLVPTYFSAVPQTDVPAGWHGREPYAYSRQGERGFAVRFNSASYISCGYERSRDGWECD